MTFVSNFIDPILGLLVSNCFKKTSMVFPEKLFAEPDLFPA